MCLARKIDIVNRLIGIKKIIKNFLVDNYDEEIKDGDLICTDLIYYSKDLKKKVKDK